MRTSLLLLLISLSEGALTWAGELELTACLPQSTAIPSQTLMTAQGYATRIYQQIGVDLRWQVRCKAAERNAPGTTTSPNLRALGMDWAPHAPDTIGPHARASAYWFRPTGTRVVLYLDRIQPLLLLHPNAAGALLGHILAHEIGHVLLQNPRHTEDGLMKASWTGYDESGMRVRPLTFEDKDAAAILYRLHQPEPA